MGPGLLGQSMNGGQLSPIPPNAPREVQIAAINDIMVRLNGLLKAQVFSDGNSKRMLIGYQKDGWGSGKDFGMKVSIPGVDVMSATEAQLLFKMDLTTWYYYDPETGKNVIQLGILPDGSGGMAVAKPNTDVDEAF